MKSRLRTFLWLLLLAITGCQGPHSAGTSTETENAIATRRFLVDSVLPQPGLPSDQPAVATLRLDASRLDFTGSRPDGQDLIMTASDGRTIPFEIVFWDPAASLGRLRVRIDPWIRTTGSQIILSTGVEPKPRSAPDAVWAGIPLAQKTEWNSVLLDDFESGDLAHNRLPDASFWFLGGAIPASGLATSVAGRTGSSLHLSCASGQCDTGKAILSATLLANSRRSFRSMDSLEFWTRGTGRVWISLESLDSVQMGRLSRGRLDSLQPRRTWAVRDLGTTWQRWSLKPSDFKQADGVDGNLGWEALRDSINYITILEAGGTELWIDDIRFHGILPDDLR